MEDSHIAHVKEISRDGKSSLHNDKNIFHLNTIRKISCEMSGKLSIAIIALDMLASPVAMHRSDGKIFEEWWQPQPLNSRVIP